MRTMKKSTLTIFCILAGCIFFLSGIWIYFQKNPWTRSNWAKESALASLSAALSDDRQRQRYPACGSPVYESATKQQRSRCLRRTTLTGTDEGYSQEDCLQIGIASHVDGIILEADGSKDEQNLIEEACPRWNPGCHDPYRRYCTRRISFVGLNSYEMGSAYTDQIAGDAE